MRIYEILRDYYFSGTPTTLRKLLKVSLTPFVPLYASARALHQKYRSLRRVSVETPVLSVGNVSLGGTGKTAFVLRLIGLLRERGVRPAVLKRGEGGGSGILTERRPLEDVAEEFGDEVALYREEVPDVPVGVGSDRVERARELSERSDVDVLLLDDGFQYRCLERDLDLVLLTPSDVTNNWQLPAGPLREPLSALQRADLVSLKGGEEPLAETVLSDLEEHLREETKRLTHEYSFEGIFRDGEDRTEDFRENGGVLLSTLARPERLETFLESVGVTVLRHRALPDHSEIVPDELEEDYDVERLMMTPKAAVKLPARIRRRVGIVRSVLKIEPLVELIHVLEDVLGIDGESDRCD